MIEARTDRHTFKGVTWRTAALNGPIAKTDRQTDRRTDIQTAWVTDRLTWLNDWLLACKSKPSIYPSIHPSIHRLLVLRSIDPTYYWISLSTYANPIMGSVGWFGLFVFTTLANSASVVAELRSLELPSFHSIDGSTSILCAHTARILSTTSQMMTQAPLRGGRPVMKFSWV